VLESLDIHMSIVLASEKAEWIGSELV